MHLDDKIKKVEEAIKTGDIDAIDDLLRQDEKAQKYFYFESRKRQG